MQEVGRELVDQLQGSVLALATIGNLLRSKKTLKGWKDIRNSLTRRLEDADGIGRPSDYQTTVFGVFDLVLEELEPEPKQLVLALCSFARGHSSLFHWCSLPWR